MYLAVLKPCCRRSEDEVGSSFYVAVEEEVALYSSEFTEASVGVQGVLIAEEAAAAEEQEVSVREHCNGLGYVFTLSGAVLEGYVLEGDVAGGDIDGSAAGCSHREVATGPAALGVVVVGYNGAKHHFRLWQEVRQYHIGSRRP